MHTLGTILYLKNGTQKVMVISRNALLEVKQEKQLFDYVGCKYPTGFNPKTMIYFNEENIDTIIFKGYEDEEEIRMNEVFESWKNDNNGTYKKGIIE